MESIQESNYKIKKLKEGFIVDNARKDQVVSLCQKLIQQKSYSGHEDGVVKVLSENMKDMGFDEVSLIDMEI